MVFRAKSASRKQRQYAPWTHDKSIGIDLDILKVHMSYQPNAMAAWSERELP